MEKTQVFCDGCKREINTNHEADGGESYFRFDEVRALLNYLAKEIEKIKYETSKEKKV